MATTRRAVSAVEPFVAFEDAMVGAGTRWLDSPSEDDDEHDRRLAAFMTACAKWMRAQGWRAPKRRNKGS
jgi:hypothetical protein